MSGFLILYCWNILKGKVLHRKIDWLIVAFGCSFVLYRYVLSSTTTMCVPFCPTSTICSWTWCSLLGSLSAIPARSCSKLTVWHTATTVPTYVPTTLWWPSSIPCSVLCKRGDVPRKSYTHWDSTCSSAAVCTRTQREIPTNGGLLSSGSTPNSDQTFVQQSMLSSFYYYY